MEKPTSECIAISQQNTVAIITLNRPKKLNAIDDAMRTDLMAAIDWAGQAEEVRAIVLTGNGKAFCAGGDIAAMRVRLEAPIGTVAMNGWKRQRRTHHAVTLLHGLAKPTIAAVNGAAAGLGTYISADIRYIRITNLDDTGAVGITMGGDIIAAGLPLESGGSLSLTLNLTNATNFDVVNNSGSAVDVEVFVASI